MIGTWIERAPSADAPQASPAAPAPPMESAGATGIDQLAFLVGGTWVSVSGSKIVEETCTWGVGNQSIRTVVVLRSGSQVTGGGNGRFSYDTLDDKLLSHSNLEQEGVEQRMFARQALPSEGTCEWSFQGIFMTDAGVQHRPMTLTQISQNEMRVDQFEILNGNLKLLVSTGYTRVPWRT